VKIIPKIEKRKKKLQHREWQYKSVFELLEQGVPIAQIARQIGLSREMIYQIRDDPECKPVETSGEPQ